MENLSCPNCNAVMKTRTNNAGITIEYCEYCGYEHENLPESTRDVLFSLANRALNGLGVKDGSNYFKIKPGTPSKPQQSSQPVQSTDKASASSDGLTSHDRLELEKAKLEQRKEVLRGIKNFLENL